MGTLTIFRGAAIESDDDALRYAAEDLGASVENVGIAALRARVLSSLATGAVVLVAADDRMATIGLAAGAGDPSTVCGMNYRTIDRVERGCYSVGGGIASRWNGTGWRG